MDRRFQELEDRENDEKQRESEFSESVEEAKRNLEEERKRFEDEKKAFEESHQVTEEPDSGIGSRNDSAEVFDDEAEQEYESEEEIVPPRRNKYLDTSCLKKYYY